MSILPIEWYDFGNNELLLGGDFFWPAGRGLGGVQRGAGLRGAREAWARRGGGVLEAQVFTVQMGFEAIYSWKQHTVLT